MAHLQSSPRVKHHRIFNWLHHERWALTCPCDRPLFSVPSLWEDAGASAIKLHQRVRRTKGSRREVSPTYFIHGRSHENRCCTRTRMDDILRHYVSTSIEGGKKTSVFHSRLQLYDDRNIWTTHSAHFYPPLPHYYNGKWFQFGKM